MYKYYYFALIGFDFVCFGGLFCLGTVSFFVPPSLTFLQLFFSFTTVLLSDSIVLGFSFIGFGGIGCVGITETNYYNISINIHFDVS